MKGNEYIHDVDTKDDQVILSESTLYQINPMINMGMFLLMILLSVDI